MKMAGFSVRKKKQKQKRNMLFHLHKKQWLHPTAKEKILKAARRAMASLPQAASGQAAHFLLYVAPAAGKFFLRYFTRQWADMALPQ